MAENKQKEKGKLVLTLSYLSVPLSLPPAMSLQHLGKRTAIYGKRRPDNTARASRQLVRPSMTARSMLSTQRVNSIFQERVSFSTTSRVFNTPPPTGPLTPPPAAPGTVKVKVSFNAARLDPY